MSGKIWASKSYKCEGRKETSKQKGTERKKRNEKTSLQNHTRRNKGRKRKKSNPKENVGHVNNALLFGCCFYYEKATNVPFFAERVHDSMTTIFIH